MRVTMSLSQVANQSVNNAPQQTQSLRGGKNRVAYLLCSYDSGTSWDAWTRKKSIKRISIWLCNVVFTRRKQRRETRSKRTGNVLIIS